MPSGPLAAQKAPFGQVILLVNHAGKLLDRVAGLSVLERQLLTLARAGVRRVLITVPEPKGIERLRRPPGMEVSWVGPGSDEAEARLTPPYTTVSADYLIDPDVLKAVLRHPHDQPTSYQDTASRGIVQAVPMRSDLVTRFQTRELPSGTYVLLETPPDKTWSWLVRRAIKSQDSFMARNFDRKISLAVTRRLIDTSIHPNHMTIFSTLLGLTGAGLLAPGVPLATVLGALVVWLHTVLDGCDGELARLRMQTSRWGGILDFWGDNLVHFALFSCLGLGLYHSSKRPIFLLLGGVAALSSFISAFLVYRHSSRRARRREAEGAASEAAPLFQGLEDLASDAGGQAPAGALRRGLARLEHILSQRDFVYLLVFLALSGHLDLFLWAAGIGTPLFLLILIGLSGFAEGPEF